MDENVTSQKIKTAVRQAYGNVARHADRAGQSCCGPQPAQGCCSPQPTQSCCGPQPAQDCCGPQLAQSSLEDAPPEVMEAIHAADLSLSCGNPTAIGGLQPGEVVLDLGSGAGLDCFLAAVKVGPEGRVIGLDMTPEMVELARRNARRAGLGNVEFRRGEIEDIPLPDQSVDVIISNCVINLSPDKDAVFQEAYRVLRPGGRMVVSDIVLHGELPQPIRDSLHAWASCVAGALEEADYLDKIRVAGFDDVEVIANHEVKISADDWENAQQALVDVELPLETLERKVLSITVQARKA